MGKQISYLRHLEANIQKPQNPPSVPLQKGNPPSLRAGADIEAFLPVLPKGPCLTRLSPSTQARAKSREETPKKQKETRPAKMNHSNEPKRQVLVRTVPVMDARGRQRTRRGRDSFSAARGSIDRKPACNTPQLCTPLICSIVICVMLICSMSSQTY